HQPLMRQVSRSLCKDLSSTAGALPLPRGLPPAPRRSPFFIVPNPASISSRFVFALSSLPRRAYTRAKMKPILQACFCFLRTLRSSEALRCFLSSSGIARFDLRGGLVYSVVTAAPLFIVLNPALDSGVQAGWRICFGSF